jgi:hypothetical protein
MNYPKLEYRIAELHRQYSLECSKDGQQWLPVKATNVPQYFETLQDARSWVATLRRGRVIHSVEDDGLQWFLDRVGKSVVYNGMTFNILDDDHARHLHTASVEVGYVFEDAPNLPVDERKAEKGIGLSPEDRAWVKSRPIKIPKWLSHE